MSKHETNPFCNWPMDNAGYHCATCCARIPKYENYLKHLQIHPQKGNDDR